MMGLAASSSSIVALSESGNAARRSARPARAALKDLRLVIIGGDLSWLSILARACHGAAASHDIALDWHALTPQGLPVHPELRPWHVIQIVRLLDEALTNAVKHADARTHHGEHRDAYRRVGRGLRPHHGRRRWKGFCDRSDDPAAAPGQKAARGLRNMRSRAARCGAELELASGAGGTRVRLKLPRRFPDSDAAAGLTCSWFVIELDLRANASRLSRRETDRPSGRGPGHAFADHAPVQRRPTRLTGPPRFQGVPGRTPTPRAPTPTRPTLATRRVTRTLVAWTPVRSDRGHRHDRYHRPNNAALRHAGRLAIDHRGLGRSGAQ